MLDKKMVRPTPSTVAWTVNTVQPLYSISTGSPTDAINLQSPFEILQKSKTEILPGGILDEYVTRYRPPGTMKIRHAWNREQIDSSKILVCGSSIARWSLTSCASTLRQNSIHLVGAIAVFSSSESFILDIGKLGRKRALSVHTRKSAASHTTRCLVQGCKALQVLIIFQWYDQP